MWFKTFNYVSSLLGDFANGKSKSCGAKQLSFQKYDEKCHRLHGNGLCPIPCSKQAYYSTWQWFVSYSL